jgi:predicted double-glycine peptidase
LATLINFQHGDPVREREVALALIGREEYVAEPMLIVLREGFSLLDLKRYVEGRGYCGRALGGLAFEDLVERAPIMVVIREAGNSHFVVFRGRSGNRVLLADPAVGTRTMPVEQFKKAWVSHGELGHAGFVINRTDDQPPPNRLAPRPEEFLTFG